MKLMKPAPAISAFLTSVETGSSLTSCWAISRGFFLSALASCIARLVAKSPWEASAGVRDGSGWRWRRGNAGQGLFEQLGELGLDVLGH